MVYEFFACWCLISPLFLLKILFCLLGETLCYFCCHPYACFYSLATFSLTLCAVYVFLFHYSRAKFVLQLTAGICSREIKDVEETKDLNSAFALAQDEIITTNSLDDEIVSLNLFLLFSSVELPMLFVFVFVFY